MQAAPLANMIHSVDDVCQTEFNGRTAPHLSALAGSLPEQCPPQQLVLERYVHYRGRPNQARTNPPLSVLRSWRQESYQTLSHDRPMYRAPAFVRVRPSTGPFPAERVSRKTARLAAAVGMATQEVGSRTLSRTWCLWRRIVPGDQRGRQHKKIRHSRRRRKRAHCRHRESGNACGAENGRGR